MTNEQLVAVIQAAKELTLDIAPVSKISSDNIEYNKKLAEQVGETYSTIFQSIKNVIES